jgi:alpha-glucan,water dikinase
MRGRNPLDLVNRATPPKLAEKGVPRDTPLSRLVQAAGEEEAVCWSRVYPLGSKAQLLCVVRKVDPASDDSPLEVVLTTDTADDVVLHWGVKKAGRKGEWVKPAEALLPPNTDFVKGGIAAETPFVGCDDKECVVEIGGAVVPLQRVAVELPRGHDLTAVTFVLRSEDGTRWCNDGGANFNVPVPGAGKEAAPPVELNDEISRIIVDAEVNSGGWTLMHRYNKSADLVAEIIKVRCVLCWVFCCFVLG